MGKVSIRGSQITVGRAMVKEKMKERKKKRNNGKDGCITVNAKHIFIYVVQVS